ncbi:MAG: hypothetical protein JWN62_4385 [Acidimicrobiales bacterium]|nr:hypothetical protein [Acidimicrobiales bacterium]
MHLAQHGLFRRLVLVGGLTAFAAAGVACSSGSKSSATTTKPLTSVAISDAQTGTTSGTTPGSTAGSSGETTSGTGTPATASDDPGTNRAIVVSYTLGQGKQFGYNLEESCVTGVVSKLSDDDVALLAASTLDTAPGATSPQLSPEGEALGNSVLDCAVINTNTALIAQAAAVVMGYQGASTLDPECVTKALSRLSDDQLQLAVDSGPQSTDPRLQPVGFALFQCLPTSTT